MTKVTHTIYLAVITVLGTALIWSNSQTKNSVRIEPTIAVLQFVSVGPPNSSTGVASRLSDDLIQYFADNDNMDVIPGHNVNAAFDRNLTMSEIGGKLSATVILEGAVRESNDRIRVTVQLIDVESEDHLWSQTYDRQLGDTDGIVSDIGRAVTRQF